MVDRRTVAALTNFSLGRSAAHDLSLTQIRLHLMKIRTNSATMRAMTEPICNHL
jgi:hypothetical protein